MQGVKGAVPEVGSITVELAGELTPISVDEARKVIGKESRYSSGEALAMAVLDFTAIARAYLRTVSRFEVLNHKNMGYN